MDIEIAREVVRTWQAQKVRTEDGTILLDGYTASLMVQVYDGLSPANRDNANSMSLAKYVDICFKIANKNP